MVIRFQKLLLYVILVLLPSQLAYHMWPSWSYVSGLPVDYLSPTLYLTDIFIGGFILLSFKSVGKQLVDVAARYKFQSLLLLIGLVSNLFFSSNLPLALYSWLRITEYVLFACSLYVFISKRSFNLSQPLFIGLCWSLILALLQLVQQHSIGGLWAFLGERPLSPIQFGVSKVFINSGEILLRPYATFPHPNVLAGFVAVVVLVTNTKSPFLKKALTIVGAISIALTFSRSAFITFTSIVAVNYQRNKLLAIFIDIVIITVLFLSGITFAPDSVSERLLLNNAAIKMVISHPLTGVGLGNFIPQLPNYLEPMQTHYALFLQPVHNAYLLTLSEFGLLFSVVVLRIFFPIFKKLWPKISNPEKLSVICVALISLVDHYWVTIHQTQLLLVILVVACLKSAHTTYEN